VPVQFHARHAATGKVYKYYLDLGPEEDPLRRGAAVFLFRGLDLQALREAAQRFEGTHDFAAFASKDPSKTPDQQRDTVRTVRSCTVEETPNGVAIRVEGPGFLYKQVRSMVGALLKVGQGKLDPAAITELLGARDRAKVPQVVPAKGLVLEDVAYPDFLFNLEYCDERGDAIYDEIIVAKHLARRSPRDGEAANDVHDEAPAAEQRARDGAATDDIYIHADGAATDEIYIHDAAPAAGPRVREVQASAATDDIYIHDAAPAAEAHVREVQATGDTYIHDAAPAVVQRAGDGEAIDNIDEEVPAAEEPARASIIHSALSVAQQAKQHGRYGGAPSGAQAGSLETTFTAGRPSSQRHTAYFARQRARDGEATDDVYIHEEIPEADLRVRDGEAADDVYEEVPAAEQRAHDGGATDSDCIYEEELRLELDSRAARAAAEAVSAAEEAAQATALPPRAVLCMSMPSMTTTPNAPRFRIRNSPDPWHGQDEDPHLEQWAAPRSPTERSMAQTPVPSTARSPRMPSPGPELVDLRSTLETALEGPPARTGTDNVYDAISSNEQPARDGEATDDIYEEVRAADQPARGAAANSIIHSALSAAKQATQHGRYGGAPSRAHEVRHTASTAGPPRSQRQPVGAHAAYFARQRARDGEATYEVNDVPVRDGEATYEVNDVPAHDGAAADDVYDEDRDRRSSTPDTTPKLSRHRQHNQAATQRATQRAGASAGASPQGAPARSLHGQRAPWNPFGSPMTIKNHITIE
jgi:hypothetical protein